MLEELGAVDDAVSSAAAVELTGRRHEATSPRVSIERWCGVLLASDAVSVASAAVVSLEVRFGLSGAAQTVDYRLVALMMVPGWLMVMALNGAYDRRHFVEGSEQYRRVINGMVWVLVSMAFLSFALRANISREFVFVAVPIAAFLTLVGRYIAGRLLHHRFVRLGAAHRVVAIGSAGEVTDLVSHIHRAVNRNFRVVAALTPGETTRPELPAGIDWAGHQLDSAVHEARRLHADTLAVAGPHLLARGALRRLSWDLEGTEIDLIVAPAITDVAGPRISIRPVDGLPLLQIEKPQFTGARRLLKDAIDRSVAVVLLLLALPVLLSCMVAVKLTSPGPFFFRQVRFGQGGRKFSMLKFRTMRADIDCPEERALREDPNAGREVLFFKLVHDPRITRVGHFLRRFSLDELPQLWNVVVGDMSLVGPRPLVAHGDVSGSDLGRRHLVKPGMTGLWQISGRSDLSVDERIRLDLHYVDNWSLGLDLVLMWKTFATVLRGNGAY